MAPSSSQSLTSLILQMAAATKDGAALKDILVLPALSLQRRKVQRRLQALVKAYPEQWQNFGRFLGKAE